MEAEITQDLINFPDLIQDMLEIPDSSRQEFKELELGKDAELEEKLNNLFNEFGSDKAESGYSQTYASLFLSLAASPTRLKRAEVHIAEIGIGTIDPTVPSAMNPERFRPGGSLRAFGALSGNMTVLGGDIDRNVLFNEGNIRTSFVNSFDKMSIEQFFGLSDQRDLIIDDGLHFIGTQVRSLTVGIQFLTPGGFIVIEDIPERSLNLFKLFSAVLSMKGYANRFVRSTKPKYLWVIQKPDHASNL